MASKRIFAVTRPGTALFRRADPQSGSCQDLPRPSWRATSCSHPSPAASERPMLSSAHARAGKRPLPQRQIQNARGPILIDSAFIE